MGDKAIGATSELNISLVLALLSLFGWVIPVVGIALSVTGLVFAVKGSRKKPSTNKATVATFICLVVLVLSLANAYIGFQRGYEYGQQVQYQYSQ